MHNIYKKINLNNNVKIIITNALKIESMTNEHSSIDIVDLTGPIDKNSIKKIDAIIKNEDEVDLILSILLSRYPEYDDEILKNNYFIYRKLSSSQLLKKSSSIISARFILYMFSSIYNKTPLSTFVFTNCDEVDDSCNIYDRDDNNLLSEHTSLSELGYIQKIYTDKVNEHGKNLAVLTFNENNLLEFLVEKDLIDETIKNEFINYCNEVKNNL